MKLESRIPVAVAAAVLSSLIVAPGLGAQLVVERLAFLPAEVTTGEGTIRLEGMGGFETTVRDENQEINLFDFAKNPAGFGDDRDSWSIDLRYSHQELTQRSGFTSGDDVKLNSGSLLLGYHDPGNVGVGGAIDYAEVTARDFTRARDEFRIVGFSLTASKYFAKQAVLGARISQTDEEQDAFSRQIYNISHTAKLIRGGLGLGLIPVRGLTLGARGEVIGNQVDGESRGTTHQDVFDWRRPGSLWAVHGTIDRGRLEGGVNYTRQDLEGEEEVEISWSERFEFNPSPEAYTAQTTTMTEDRTNKSLRSRWRLQVIPRRISVSLATLNAEEDFTVLGNPNVLGSLSPGTLSSSSDAVVGGVSLITARQRLLVAAEVKSASTEVTQTDPYTSVTVKRDDMSYHLGGEYLIGETLAGRLGLVHSIENFEVTENSVSDKSEDYNTTYVAVGIGLIPDGGIWQLDLAYGVNVDSDLDTDQSRFSAYLKYLF